MESDIQEIATHIGFMLDNFASRLVEKLPATLTRENSHLFLRAFEDCGDSSKCIRVFFGDGSRDNACVEYGFPD